jgi:hypothetical protein
MEIAPARGGLRQAASEVVTEAVVEVAQDERRFGAAD